MDLRPSVSKQDHIQGTEQAAVTLVEFGDYRCRHCRLAHRIIKLIQKRFAQDLRFVFRHFPLSQIHPHAKKAAVAAEAAAKQGRFWEMHDIIFENEGDLPSSTLLDLAERIGLDVKQFEGDLENEILVEKVEADFESGLQSGVNGTPGFFINGEKYTGDWNEDRLSDYIRNKIYSPVP